MSQGHGSSWSLAYLGVVVIVFGLIARYVCALLYNLYFHPLRKFPGPILRRCSFLPHVYHLNIGDQPREISRLHEIYGPVVRYTPDDLSFLNAQAWQDIYGHRIGANHGITEIPKAAMMYRTPGIPPSLIAEDRDTHAMMRKQMAHGFSERSMREQEPIIASYVDLLIRRLREHSTEAVPDGEKGERRKKVVNMTTWYNWTTFDIIGDLAFGEPFECLQNAKYDPWVNAVANRVRTTAFGLSIRYLGLGKQLLPIFRKYAKPRKGGGIDEKTEAKLQRRMALEMDRHDLIEGLLKKKDEWNLDFTRLRVNASLFILAGSETTATLLTGVTYLLLTNPETMKKLTTEVRSLFSSDSEITLSSVTKLPYMLACLNEAMRRYPPVPIGLPRQVPEEGATIDGHFVPEGARVSCWQWPMGNNAKNFQDPLTYKPERWLDEGRNPKDQLEAVQPFSVGPRNCLGRNLAIAEMRLILGRVLFNFDMELADPEDDWLDQKAYALWAKKPLQIFLTPAP